MRRLLPDLHTGTALSVLLRCCVPVAIATASLCQPAVAQEKGTPEWFKNAESVRDTFTSSFANMERYRSEGRCDLWEDEISWMRRILSSQQGRQRLLEFVTPEEAAEYERRLEIERKRGCRRPTPQEPDPEPPIPSNPVPTVNADGTSVHGAFGQGTTLKPLPAEAEPRSEIPSSSALKEPPQGHDKELAEQVRQAEEFRSQWFGQFDLLAQYRKVGNCQARSELIDFLDKYFQNQADHLLQYITPEELAEMKRLLVEEKAQPCAPPSEPEAAHDDGQTSSPSRTPAQQPLPAGAEYIRQPNEFAPNRPAPDGPGSPADQRDSSANSPGFLIFGGFGYADTEVPLIGTGFKREGLLGEAPEEFALETDGRIDVWTGEIGFAVSSFDVWLRYGEGSGRTSGVIPANADISSGFVYDDFSPVDNTTGADLGPSGLTSSTATDFSQWEVGVSRLAADYSLGSDKKQVLRVSYGAYAGLYETKIQTASSVSGAVEGFDFRFDQSSRRKLKEKIFGANLTTEYSTPLGSDATKAWIMGKAGVYAYDFDFRSTQLNSSNVLEDFTIEKQQGDSGVGYRLGASIGLTFDLGGPQLTLSGGYDYMSDRADMFIPFSGDHLFVDGLSAALTRRGSDSVYVNARIAFPLGGLR